MTQPDSTPNKNDDLTLFFDLGRIGGFVILLDKTPLITESFELPKIPPRAAEKKAVHFRYWLEEKFPTPSSYTRVATFIPRGIGRWTTIHLSMMVGVLAGYFYKSEIKLVDEWTAWRKISGINQIPERREKKIATQQWASGLVGNNKISEDEADAVMGAMYLINYMI